MAIQELIPDITYKWKTKNKRQCLIQMSIVAGVFIGLTLLATMIYLEREIVKCDGNSGDVSSVNAAYFESMARVLNNMDTSVDPCEDFYAYACGGWLKKHPLPPGRRTTTSARTSANALSNKMRVMLRGSVVDKSEHSAERKMKAFYKLCLEQYGRDRNGPQPFVQDLMTDIGGWYVTHPNSFRDGWSLTDIIPKVFINYGVSVIFRLTHTFYGNNDNKTRLSISRPRYAFKYRYSTDEEKEAFRKSVLSIGQLLLRDGNVTGDSAQMERLDQFADDVLIISKLLMDSLRLRREITRPSSYLTLGMLQESIDLVNWTSLVDKVIGENHIVSPDMKIFMYEESRFSNFSAKLNTLTDKVRMLNNYAVWKVTSVVGEYLSSDYQQALAESRRSVDDSVVWQKCFNLVIDHFSASMANEFFRVHHQSTAGTEVLDMISEIRNTFKSEINLLELMDDETKDTAIRKLSEMTSQVGIPDSIDTKTEVDKLYEGIDIYPSQDLYNTLQTLNKFQVICLSNRLKATFSENIYTYPRVLVNTYGYVSYYISNHNDLAVLNGGIMPPHYYPRGPVSINYGSIGEIIAENIVMSIFGGGQYFTEKYQRNQKSWWSNSSLLAMQDKSKCFLDYFESQYNRSIKRRDSTASFLTRKAVALNLISKVYQRMTQMDTFPTDTSLSKEKLFFLSTTQNWCQKMNDIGISRDQSQGWFTSQEWCNGITAHSKDFADTFQCKQGSPMVPDQYCTVM